MKIQNLFIKRYLTIVACALIMMNNRLLLAQQKSHTNLNKPQSTILLNITVAEALRGSSAIPGAQASPTKSLMNYNSSVEREYNKEGSVVGLFGASLIAGAIGYALGGYLGYGIESSGCSDDYENHYCGIAGLLIGASAGGALSMPLGTHLANGRRGNFGTTLLATLGATGLAWGLAVAAQDVEGLLVMVPLFQIGTSIAIERITGRKP